MASITLPAGSADLVSNERGVDSAALRAYYESIWPALLRGVPKGCGVSAPLFITVPGEYANAQTRMMVVGQETKGWDGPIEKDRGDDPIGAIQKVYADFDMGKHYKATPFWRAFQKLQSILAREFPSYGVVWSNVFPCDQNRGRPTPYVSPKLLALGSLPNEVRLLKPDLIVFFTGPNYDDALRQLFPGVTFDAMDGKQGRSLSRVICQDLWQHAFRTYHPGYFRRTRQEALLQQYLETIVATIKQPS